ncbi:MAG: hypothetical protein ACD_19C00258G0001 [uncultured bacterium]|nr:MAG: hypothetical protein ACD_19C00258G0001 [uncultured bacterium]
MSNIEGMGKIIPQKDVNKQMEVQPITEKEQEFLEDLGVDVQRELKGVEIVNKNGEFGLTKTGSLYESQIVYITTDPNFTGTKIGKYGVYEASEQKAGSELIDIVVKKLTELQGLSSENK